jgi:hypothetical protein
MVTSCKCLIISEAFSYDYANMSAASFPRKPMKVVEVEVADGKVYPVFAEMIMHFSAYFSACLSNGWQEATTFKVKLEDLAWASVFPLLVEWMLRRELKIEYLAISVQEVWGDKLVYNETNRPTWRECVNLWLLGDYLQMPTMQNYVIGFMVCKAHNDIGYAGGAFWKSPLQ